MWITNLQRNLWLLNKHIRCVEDHDQCETEHAKKMSTTLDKGYLRWIIIGKLLLWLSMATPVSEMMTLAIWNGNWWFVTLYEE